MALYIPFSRYISRSLRRNIKTNINSLKYNNTSNTILTLEEDSLDDFTSRLMQKKVEKWSTRKTSSTISLNTDSDYESKDNISQLSNIQINTLFHEAIDNNNNSRILELIDQCILQEKIPSVSNLFYSLSVCSQTGNISTIKNIQKLYRKYPKFLQENSNFQHYVAEAIWIKGNANEGLNLFKEVYEENTYLRRRIRLMLKNLILNIITNRSEAVLVNITKFAEDLAKDYNDFYPLTCIWQTCFLSDWFTDQCLALDLLNKYTELCKAVINRIPYVVAVSLRNHRVEVVYRLLEILLRFEMKLQYTGVLLVLLDYQIHQKNIRRCLEIVHWSEQNGIELLPVHHEKYLKLLINYKDDKSVLMKQKPPKPLKSKTHFKF